MGYINNFGIFYICIKLKQKGKLNFKQKKYKKQNGKGTIEKQLSVKLTPFLCKPKMNSVLRKIKNIKKRKEKTQ